LYSPLFFTWNREGREGTEADVYLNADDGAVLLEERAHVIGRAVPRDVLRDEPRPRLHFLLRHRLRRRGRGGTSGRAGSESEGGAVTAGAGSEGDVARGEAQAKRGLALAGGGRGEEAGEGERHGESSRR